MRNLTIALSFVALSAMPALAASEGKRGSPEMRKFCTSDALTLCPDIDPDDLAMNACFAKNRNKLSKNCRRAIDAYKAARGQ